MYLNPQHMSIAERQRVMRWLQANGCRDVVAVAPITVRGRVVEYVSLGRASRPLRQRLRHTAAGWPFLPQHTRRLRVRIPLGAVV